jgi:hypothetical protein
MGDISNPGANVANFFEAADWNGQDGNVTTVGSAGNSSASPYGTFDQGGNVHERNETVFDSSRRGLRGGSRYSTFDLRADFPFSNRPSPEVSGFGFRVATVPEPQVRC